MASLTSKEFFQPSADGVPLGSSGDQNAIPPDSPELVSPNYSIFHLESSQALKVRALESGQVGQHRGRAERAAASDGGGEEDHLSPVCWSAAAAVVPTTDGLCGIPHPFWDSRRLPWSVQMFSHVIL